MTIRAGLQRIEEGGGEEGSTLALAFVAERPEVRALGAILQLPAADRRQALARTPLSQGAIDRVLELVRLLETAPQARQALAQALPSSIPSAASAEWEAWLDEMAEVAAQPVFGEEGAVHLEDIYVPSRFELRRSDAPVQRLLDPSAAREPDEVARDAVRRIQELLGDGEEFVCVVGAPGSGKSSLARMLTSALARSGRWRPVLAHFRDLRGDANLEAQLREQLARSAAEGSRDDLAARFEQAPGVVLVLDGFDELGRSGSEGLRGLFLRVRELVRRLGVRVVLTGRDTLLSGPESFPGEAVLVRLLPFDDDQVREWGRRWAAARGDRFDVERYLREQDEAEEGEPLDGLARQPLLLYLLAYLESEGLDLDTAGDSTAAQVFQRILTQLCQRFVAARPESGLTHSKLRRLLGLAGWVAMVRGEPRVRLDDLQRAVRLHMQSLGEDQIPEHVEGTLLSFYFRRVGNADEWEFLHKSFGEYLAAEHLSGVLHRLIQRESDAFGEERYTLGERAAAEEFLGNFGPAKVPSEVEDWMPPMLADWPRFLAGAPAKTSSMPAVEARLSLLAPRLLDEVDGAAALGVADAWSGRVSRVIECAVFNCTALAGLTATSRGERLDLLAFCNDRWDALYRCLFDYERPLMEQLERTTGRGRIEGGERDLGKLFSHREVGPLQAAGGGSNLAGSHLDGAELSEVSFSGTLAMATLLYASLRGAKLAGVSVVGCSLLFADLREADVRGATFLSSALWGALLEGALVAGATFKDSRCPQLDGKLARDGTILPQYIDEDGRFRPDGAKPSP